MAEDLPPSSPSEDRNAAVVKFLTAFNGLTSESQKEITSLLLNENKSTAEVKEKVQSYIKKFLETISMI
ncbi:unnamed protein product [Rotaria magnacalcarata]|uniref:Uncharacterized protein n=1 Tax=Rotaria magnacalcarata TaxID=392030 RepID=A0A817AAG9_9BILA|nr:unnamed protein product [Rotaria magnacalcarata]CAF4060545.1 unnamed protein product [Rotaria magnacalcarata]